VEGEPRRNPRSHPLRKRLLLLAPLAVLVVVLIRPNLLKQDEPEHEVVWRLEGPGWSDIRTLELQVKAADGELLKRQVNTFPGAPPVSITLNTTDLPPGKYEVWVFARGREGPSSPPRVESLTLREGETFVQRGLRVPASR
jgi:hypothetical protein